jgi:hypothetical protein
MIAGTNAGDATLVKDRRRAKTYFIECSRVSDYQKARDIIAELITMPELTY